MQPKLWKLNVLFDLILFVSQLVNTASDLRADLMTLLVWPVSTNLLSKTIKWKMLRCFVLQFFFKHFLWTWKVNKMHKNLIHALTRHLSGKCFRKELTYAQCISVTLR